MQTFFVKLPTTCITFSFKTNFLLFKLASHLFVRLKEENKSLSMLTKASPINVNNDEGRIDVIGYPDMT